MKLALALLVACTQPVDTSPFASMQMCFDAQRPNFTINDSIVICCIQHPIAGMQPACGPSADACVTFVTSALSPSDASPDAVTAACADYQHRLPVDAAP